MVNKAKLKAIEQYKASLPPEDKQLLDDLYPSTSSDPSEATNDEDEEDGDNDDSPPPRSDVPPASISVAPKNTVKRPVTTPPSQPLRSVIVPHEVVCREAQPHVQEITMRRSDRRLALPPSPSRVPDTDNVFVQMAQEHDEMDRRACQFWSNYEHEQRQNRRQHNVRRPSRYGYRRYFPRQGLRRF